MLNALRRPAFLGLAALLATGAFAGHLPAPALDEEVAMQGVLGVLHGDPEPGSGQAAQRIFVLTTDEGRDVELDFAQAARPPEGIHTLVGRRIEVRAKALPDALVHDASAPRRYRVTIARPLPGAKALAKVTGTLPYVSLLCRFADIGTDPRTPAYFNTQLSNTAPGFDHYFREASYNSIVLTGSTASAGWVSLPQPRGYYIDGVKSPTTFLGEIFNDCVNAHDGAIDFSGFHGINIMLNGQLDNAAWGGGRFRLIDGVNKVWPTTWMPYHGEGSTFGWRSHAVLAHEMSHSFGAPHSESPSGDEYGSSWDVVSSPGAGCYTVDANYGCLGQHMNAYAKTLMGVIAPARIATHNSSTQSYDIERLALPPNAGGTHQMVRVNISGTTTRWYTIESRFKTGNYDSQLLGNGVVIHEIDTLRAGGNDARLVVPGGSTAQFYGRLAALWQPGMVFRSQADNIRIEINSISPAGTANVTVGSHQSFTDSFPAGCAMPAGWTTTVGATTGWVADPTAAAVGTCSLKSNTLATPAGGSGIVNRAQVEYTGFMAAGNISFWARASSEPGWDCLRFAIDGTDQNIGNCANTGGAGLTPSGNETDTGWRFYSFPVAAGVHTARWSYEKDEAASGIDAAWIDSVSFPVATLADLSLTQSASPSPAANGKDFILTLGASNAGPQPATNTVITHTVPAGTSFIWASPGCAHAAGTVTCPVGTLASGATSPEFKVVVRPSSTGAKTSNASVAATETDPTPANNASALNVPVDPTPAGVPVQRYRLYSPVTLEHHFTTDLNEYNVLGSFVGTWVQEGTVGRVLNNPGSFNAVTAVPYYRLYDTSTRWHHWTTDANEYYTLGLFPWWNQEGVDGYILPTNTVGATELYRLLYPFVAGLHHWTIDANEYNTLINSFGWIGEGGSGFVVQ